MHSRADITDWTGGVTSAVGSFGILQVLDVRSF
jgi:hypothetical protein